MPEVMERKMYQWWCYDCRKWVGQPHDTTLDVRDHVIAAHLSGHSDDRPEPEAELPYVAGIQMHAYVTSDAPFAACSVCGLHASSQVHVPPFAARPTTGEPEG